MKILTGNRVPDTSQSFSNNKGVHYVYVLSKGDINMWIRFRKKITYYDYTTPKHKRDLAGNIIECNWGSSYVKNQRWEWRWKYIGKIKYQKKAHHKKKTKSQKQLNKEAWREHKQVKRDKAKRQDLHGCPVWMKRHCNKTHRQWENRCIHHERYEELGNRHYKRKDIFDPWMWD